MIFVFALLKIIHLQKLQNHPRSEILQAFCQVQDLLDQDRTAELRRRWLRSVSVLLHPSLKNGVLKEVYLTKLHLQAGI